VGENLEGTVAYPQLFVGVPAATTLGRLVSEDNWRLSPPLVMMLKGRPELNSIWGANVQLLKSLLAKPLPLSLPVW